MVPFMDLSRMHGPLQDSFAAAFERVMADGRYIMGPDVAALENEVSSLTGVAHAIGVSSGTDALLAALMALKVGPGDEVIVPSFTFFATAGVVTRTGATPVFADVDPKTFLMDSEDALSRVTSRTRAFIPVHIYGQCVDLAPYHQTGLPIIEDAAQSMGAEHGTRQQSGSAGDMGCFSFFPTKPLGGFGDGGMVVTSNADLADQLRLIRVHGARPKFHHEQLGGNFRLDALQAALLRIKLPHLSSWARARQDNAARYREALLSLEEKGHIQLTREVAGTHVYHQFVIRATRRQALQDALQGKVATAIYYPEPLHLQPCFADLGYKKGDLPVVEQACNEVLALPCFPGLSAGEQAQVVQSISDFYLA